VTVSADKLLHRAGSVANKGQAFPPS
jgi:hypothetical protein